MIRSSAHYREIEKSSASKICHSLNYSIDTNSETATHNEIIKFVAFENWKPLKTNYVSANGLAKALSLSCKNVWASGHGVIYAYVMTILSGLGLPNMQIYVLNVHSIIKIVCYFNANKGKRKFEW